MRTFAGNCYIERNAWRAGRGYTAFPAQHVTYCLCICMLPYSPYHLCKVVRSVLLSPDMMTAVIALRCTVNQDNSADEADQLSFDVSN